jgi:hypothetical protein
MRKRQWAKKELKRVHLLAIHKETLQRLEKSEVQWVNGGGVLRLPVGVVGDTSPSNCVC